MSTLVISGFLSTAHDMDALHVAGARDVRDLDLLALTDEATREEALTRAAAEVRGGDVLVGYSMGARVVLALLRDPHVAARVRHALLLSGTPGLEGDDERAARAQTESMWSAALRTDAGAFVEMWSTQPLFTRVRGTEAGRAQLARRRTLATLPAWGKAWAHANDVLGASACPSLWDALPLMQTPTTWITGTADERFGAIAARAVSQMPNASHRIVEGCGHALLLEAPEVISSVIQEVSMKGPTSMRGPSFTDEGAQT